jgi:hypothetical protein
MPHSRKRPGHHPYKKAADIPASQRTNGKFTWALLFAIFGFLITFFAAGMNYIALAAGSIIAGIIGYIIGKNMERAAKE